MFRLTPVVRAILLANAVLFMAQWFVGEQALQPLELWPLGTDAYYAGLPFRPWQLLSYGFLHFEFWHLFFNMIGLVVFGPAVERLLGGRRFQVYYLVCVVGAAVAQLAVTALLSREPAPTVGASGGVFGVLFAFALSWPQQRLLVFPIPVPVPAWLFITGYALLELYQGVVGRNEGVAHFAHLGGMAAGYLLLLAWRRGRPTGVG
jgi:membrane associated rhomboid family serine protease